MADDDDPMCALLRAAKAAAADHPAMSVLRAPATHTGAELLNALADDALWGFYGRGAGPVRNAAMLRLRPDVVYAYSRGDSRGTRDMVNRARDAGIETIVRRG